MNRLSRVGNYPGANTPSENFHGVIDLGGALILGVHCGVGNCLVGYLSGAISFPSHFSE